MSNMSPAEPQHWFDRSQEKPPILDLLLMLLISIGVSLFLQGTFESLLASFNKTSSRFQFSKVQRALKHESEHFTFCANP